MAEHLTITWTHEQRVSPGQLASAILSYQQSTACVSLMQDIEEAFQQYQQVEHSRMTFRKVVHAVYVDFLNSRKKSS